MNVLSIRNLSKSFGQQQIIKDLNMSVPEGSVFGFIGQNGAGKTTTMKMVLGLLQPDQGEILVCNEPVHFGQTKTNQYIGYLPDVPEFYNYMTAMQYLTLCGEIVGLPKENISQKGKRLLSLVGLDGVEKRVGGYSRGMKQRLGIAQALLADPKLLICDEPTSALDPVGRKEILDILYKIRGTTTVLFSTHTNAWKQFLFIPPQGFPPYFDFARSGLRQAKQHFHGRGLSSSISPQQAIDSSSFHMKINIFNGSLFPINFSQLLCFDQIIAHTYFLAFRVAML